jgi:hypothetical protein
MTAPPRASSAGQSACQARSWRWLDLAGKSTIVTRIGGGVAFPRWGGSACYFFDASRNWRGGAASISRSCRLRLTTLKSLVGGAVLPCRHRDRLGDAKVADLGSVAAIVTAIILSLLAYFAMIMSSRPRMPAASMPFGCARLSGFRRRQIWAKSSWFGDRALKPHAAALGAGDACYRLIYASPTTLYVFKPVKGRNDLEPPVLVIPRSEITAYRTLPNEDSCAT